MRFGPLFALASITAVVAGPAAGQTEKPAETLDLAALVARPGGGDAAAVTARYDADRGSLYRAYAVPFSAARHTRLTAFLADWFAAVAAVPPEKLSPAAREDLVALRARIENDRRALAAEIADARDVAPLVPFGQRVVALEDARRRMEPVDPVKAAAAAALPDAVRAARAVIERGPKNAPFTRKTVTRAADAADRLRGSLKFWFSFYDGYDPLFSWWVAKPVQQADAALDAYAKLLREKAGNYPTDAPEAAAGGRETAPPPRPAGPSEAPDLLELLTRPRSDFIPVVRKYRDGRRRGDREPAAADAWPAALAKVPFETLNRGGQVDYILLKNALVADARAKQLRAAAGRPAAVTDDSGITGRPIGRAALLGELATEMIAYSPEELVAIAQKELAWCEVEIKKASREMGCGDDWKAAVEKVKRAHAAPGGQPELIRKLAVEATDYVRTNNLVTVPPLAAETWRMEMMSPDRQLISPFFTGGEVISVAFPTNTMSHDAKLQSLRGNNPHFSRATVHHELIPGHHLQQFMNARENTHRAPFGTACWTEGWAFYWEMVLYARGFAVTPEDRVGFLVWRRHRCCRVIFSLGFHLGTLTPKQCVALLVDQVGFEPENAAAEVRRSFGGGYGPLYQAAYFIGANQFWALRKELVDTKVMTEPAFHDAILRENRIPVEMVRALLTKEKLAPEYTPNWKFAGPNPLPAKK